MSRNIIKKLLMTSAFVAASFGAVGQGMALDLAADGPTGAQAPATAAAGTTGDTATNGADGTVAVRYTAAGVDGTADVNVTGGSAGNGGSDTDGNGGGTPNAGHGGNGAAGISFNGQTTPTLVVNTGIAVTGGNGGNGGNVNANVGNGGNGGNGAAGVESTTDGGIVTLNGTGSITGGNGGNAGTGLGGGTNGTIGAGGAGVAATGNTTINFGAAGSITGGTAGTGSTAHGAGISTTGTSTLVITGATGTVKSGGTNAGNAINLGGTGNLTNAALIGDAAGAGDAVNLDGSGTTALITNTGTFRTGTGNALDVTAGDTLTSLANTGGTITSAGGNAINVNGTLAGITNTGTISGTGANGVALRVGAGGNINTVTNTGGIITSANTSTTTGGTVVIGADAAGVTLTSGTISNSSTGNVIAVTADQTGAIASSSTVTAGTNANAVRFENAAGTFTNTGAVTGNITSSADAKVQTINNNTGGTINGDITLDDGADIVNLNAGTITGAVNLGAGGDTFLYGNATSATGLVGTLAFGAGTNTFTINESMTTGGVISTTAGSTTAATLAAGKTFTVNHNVDLADGSYANNATTIINAGKTLLADTDTVGASGKYVFQVTTATSTTGAGAVNGLLDMSGGTAQSGIDSAADIEVRTLANGLYANGANIRIIHGGAAETTNFTGTAVTDNSFLFDFLVRNGDDTGVTFTGADVNDVILQVSRVGGTLTTSQTARNMDAALSTIAMNGDGNFDIIQTNMTNASTESQYNAIAGSLASTVDGGAQTSGLSTSTAVANLVNGRLSDTRTGVSSGAEDLTNRFWLQGFGGTADQNTRNGTAGYDADTYGFAIGGDTQMLDGKTTVGAAVSYGNTDMNSKNLNSTDSDIDSYQVTVYGDYNFGQGTFVEALGLYARNTIDQTRHNVGGIGLTAKADYDADVYGISAGVGHTLGMAGTGFTITPKVYAEYLSYNADSYTETGAGSANLTVNPDEAKQLNLGVNLEVANRFEMTSGAILKPSASVGYKHDTQGDDVSSTSSFAAGGGSFVTNGTDLGKNAFTAGLGLDYYSSSNIQLTVGYDYENKDEYDAHSGMARASYRF